MVPRIEAAVEAKLPPLMLILEDPAHVAYDKWDIRLVKALRIYKSMRNNEGVPIYWDRSDRVVFDTSSYVSKSAAAVQRAEEKASEGKSKNYGKVIYAVPRTRDGGPLPTLDEFLEEQATKRAMMAGKIKVGGEFSNADWKPAE